MQGVIVTALLASAPIFASPTQHVVATGKTRVVSGPVQVDIRTRLATAAENAPSRATRCSGGRTACSLVDSLSISVDGKPVEIPDRAVVLLSDVASARLTRLTPNRFALILTGGDAAASYEVRLFFDRHMIRRMEIWQGEMKMMEQAIDFHDIAEEAPNS